MKTKKMTAARFRQYIPLYIMMIPGVVYLFINNYIPMAGIVVGAKVPIALTSRSAAAEESFFSLVFCAVLNEWRKSQKP